MIDPHNLPDTWEQADLEEFLLFSIAVAGHNAASTASALARLLESLRWPSHFDTPFAAICGFLPWDLVTRRQKFLAYEMRKAGMGCYERNSTSFIQVSYRNFDLRTCSIDELQLVYGIGPKTSRFFITYTRPEEADNYAILDRHILKWMRHTLAIPVPMSTPQSTGRYAELEQLFIQEANERGMLARDLDTQIWKEAQA